MHTGIGKNIVKRTLLSAVVLLFGITGILFLVNSQAATNSVSVQPEAGIITPPAVVVNDTAATGGKNVQFKVSTASDGKFTLIVIPDTQNATQTWPADFTAMTQWIAANKAALNIRYALHVGDVVNLPSDTQYTSARTSMNVLDNQVPYIMTIGNHDFDAWQPPDAGAKILANNSTNKFNQYFPVTKFNVQAGFGGNFPAGRSDTQFHKFTAGGTDWGIVTLKFVPDQAEKDWVNQIIANNPTRRFIFLTHDFLNPTSTRTTNGNKYWNEIVKNHRNVQLTINGHMVCCGLRSDPGVNGNTVWQILSDYQSGSDREANTNLRVMTFDPAASSVNVKTYSPVFNKYRTDTGSNFTITGFPFGPIQ